MPQTIILQVPDDKVDNIDAAIRASGFPSAPGEDSDDYLKRWIITRITELDQLLRGRLAADLVLDDPNLFNVPP